MFEKNYYCLVAGLREYALDSDTKGFNAREIIAEILEEVSSGDAEAVRLLYGYYDCENIIALRAGRSAYNPLGNIPAEELEQEMTSPQALPKAMAKVLKDYAATESEETEGVDLSLGFERALLTAYYEECARSKSRFVRQWSEFDRTLRNVAAAAVARSKDRRVDSVTVGKGDVVAQLQRSSAADFGLRGELTYVDAILAAVNDEQNMVEKEHKIDLIRWEHASELASSDYFNINAILSYLVKINIVARWSLLDPKRGRAMLDRIMAELDSKELIK
ncbi:MAG: DUF2764 family protein [Alistipes sp.]|jgi:hypothetical protein|nr:DUF2764 family protein [Alistipes sp.]MBQ5719450.1 DUF2764 family protein [Alistipes sp.]